MTDSYYVRFRGRVLGPFSAEKTLEMVRRGQVTRVHELSPDGLSWKKAEEFSEFFGRSGAWKGQGEQRANSVGATPVAAPAVLQWMVICDGQEFGPIDEPVLVDWIRQGRVRGDNLVWREGMSDWVAAETVQPQWFTSHADATRHSESTHTVSLGSAPVGDIDARLVNEIVSKIPWLYVLTVSIGVLSLLAIIGACSAFLHGVSMFRENPAFGTRRLVWGIMAGVQAAMTLASAIQLVRYTNALVMLRAMPTLDNALSASRKLSLFWFMTALFMVLLLGFVLFAGILQVLTEVNGEVSMADRFTHLL